MSYFFHFLDEHAQLIKEKHFDEKSLNSPMKEGYLVNCLRTNLSNAIQESRIDNLSAPFTLETVGFFNNNKDMLFFELGYLNDPGKIDLLLTKLKVYDTKRSMEIILTKSEDLPDANTCLKVLAEKTIIEPNRTGRRNPTNRNDQQHSFRR